MPVPSSSSPAPALSPQPEALARLFSVRLPRLLDRWNPQLADAFADGAWTAALPGATSLAPMVALGVGFLFAMFWPGIWMRDVYTESIIFLTLVVAGAILSGPVGVMLCAGFVAGDVLHDLVRGQYAREPLAVAGSQLISYLLLALLAVRMPQLSRRLAEGVPLPRDSSQRNMIRSALFVGCCALLVVLWCQAMIVLTRPVFTWLGGSPTTAAITQVQNRWQWLMAVAVIAAIARLILESNVSSGASGSAMIAALQNERWSGSTRRGAVPHALPAVVRVIIGAVMVTMLLAGTYTGWIDAVLVAAAVTAVGAWRAGLIGMFPPGLVALIRRIPALVRFVAAPSLGYMVSYVLINSLWSLGSFRPVMIGSLVTLCFFFVLFPRAPAALAVPGRQTK